MKSENLYVNVFLQAVVFTENLLDMDVNRSLRCSSTQSFPSIRISVVKIKMLLFIRKQEIHTVFIPQSRIH